MKLKFETIQVLVLRYRNSKSRMNKQVMSTLGPCVMAGYGMMKCHAGAGWRRCSALTENLADARSNSIVFRYFPGEDNADCHWNDFYLYIFISP